MDADATVDVFIACMEFFWTQLGVMLTEPTVPSGSSNRKPKT